MFFLPFCWILVLVEWDDLAGTSTSVLSVTTENFFFLLSTCSIIPFTLSYIDIILSVRRWFRYLHSLLRAAECVRTFCEPDPASGSS
jgi:hypothetical protein